MKRHQTGCRLPFQNRKKILCLAVLALGSVAASFSQRTPTYRDWNFSKQKEDRLSQNVLHQVRAGSTPYMFPLNLQTDTHEIPPTSPFYRYCAPIPWENCFYLDPKSQAITFITRNFWRYEVFIVNLKSKQYLYGHDPYPSSNKPTIDELVQYTKDFQHRVSSLTILKMLQTFSKPIPRVYGSKDTGKLKSQGLVWEAVCGNPAFIVQIYHIGEDTYFKPGLVKDRLYHDSYEITIVPIRDFQALAGLVPPSAMIGPDGFSLIDGRDSEGFDREGYNTLGWNRQGVNRSGERWSGRIAGCRQGPGILSMPDGASYVGVYRDDLRDGWGALLKPEGGEVQFWENGTLKESFPVGGKILSPIREWIFLGRAAKGVPVEGKGRAVSADGAWRIPEGTFRGGRLAEGSMEGPDGTLYVGRFVNDQLVQGTIRGASGWTYTGGLADGKPEGRGVVLLPDGTRYEGEFKDGTYDGQGVLSRPDGEKFEGTFRDGKPHGMGIYFNGQAVERCEYYDGKRIDQAFLIKQENEKQLEALRQEREKLAKEKADQAEMARLAAERAAAEQKAQASKSSNKLIAGIFGVGAALAGGSVGMSGAEAALYGMKVAGDVAKGDASMSGSKRAAQSIADSRTGEAAAAGAPGTAGSGTSGSGTTGSPESVGFADRMGLSGTPPASGTGGSGASSSSQKASRRTPLTFRGKTNPDVTNQIKSDYFGLYEYADGSQFQLNPDGGGWIKYASGKERLSIEWGVQLSTDGTIKESSGFMLLYVIAASGTPQEKAELLELGTDRGVIHASGWTKK